MRQDSGGADRVQSWLLRVGAGFDAAFGLAMLLVPLPAARLLGIELPVDMTWFSLVGLLLLILAGLYVTAAGGPSRHAFALVAGVGRLCGLALLWRAAMAGSGPAFWVAGLLDGSLGILHVAAALTHRRRSGGWTLVGAAGQDRT